MPAAVVSLRDGEDAFVAGAHGLGEGGGRWGSSPLSLTLRDHSGAHGEALAISDVRQHSLLVNDPLHEEDGFRAFLALPLRTAERVAGTLCVLSREPRQWSPSDEDDLALVADSVLVEIDLYRSLRRSLRTQRLAGDRENAEEARSGGAPQTTGEAFVSFDNAGITHGWNAESEHLFGASREETLGKHLAGFPQQVWTALPEGHLEYVSEHLVEYVGAAREKLLSGNWDPWVHADDLREMRRRWSAALQSGDDFDMELRLRDASGGYFWHLVRAKAQRLADGAVQRWYGTNTNVHHLKELEQARDQALEDLERVTHLLSSDRTALEAQARELREIAFALQRSNRELDQFAYVASHDLKAPLRGIANLVHWLSEDLEGRLDDKTRGYVELVEGRVHRMEDLIDGILQYSRAGRTRGAPQTIEVGRLVAEVVDILGPPERFRIQVEGYTPVILSERTPLEQVFLNLIGNAIQHADGEAPEVVVSVTDEGAGWYEFSVSDNGPGIAPEHHERIFTIFQTLRAKDETESTGIGLAVVKRIVERQGGQVWVESDLGKGAIFRFLWPDAPRETREGMAWRTPR